MREDLEQKIYKLLLGIELEVLFFSQDEESQFARKLDASFNPNYKKSHLDAVELVLENAIRLPGFSKTTKMSRIGIEFRGNPVNLDSYFQQMLRLKDFVSKQSTILGIMPAVHSQHIHTSLQGAYGTNVVEKFAKASSTQDIWSLIYNCARRTLSHFSPLVLLPEEHSMGVSYPASYKGYADDINNPRRIEFRMLSSEYATDPYLNGLVALYYLYKLIFQSDNKESYGYSIGELPWDASLKAMRESKEMANFFGPSLLRSLAGILKEYPAVSAGKIPISKVGPSKF